MSTYHRLDLRHLTLPSTPNCFLVAPEGYCLRAKPHATAPVFPFARSQLWSELLEVIGKEPRITVHDQDREAGCLAFTQRSLVFRFPDEVTICVLETAKSDQSTLALFSRSLYGRSDLGVNRARAQRILAALNRPSH